MIYLAANNSRVWGLRSRGFPLGWMMSPDGWRRPERSGREMPFALDNGMFHPPDEPWPGMKAFPAFYDLIERAIDGGWWPIFATAIDRPYLGDESIEFSVRSFDSLRWRWPTLRVALAVQDGMTPDVLDRRRWDAVFVGGSDDFKWSTFADWTRAAHDRGMWAHVARVNTKGKLRRCIDEDVDSADGTGIFRGDREQLRGVLDALTENHLFHSRGPDHGKEIS